MRWEATEAEADGRARELIDDLRLTRMMHLDAGQLSAVRRKLLEFGSCFMVPPRIALLDGTVRRGPPNDEGDHGGLHPPPARRRPDLFAVSCTTCGDRRASPAPAICMNAGAVIADEKTRAVLTDPVVIEAYLGEAAGMTALSCSTT